LTNGLGHKTIDVGVDAASGSAVGVAASGAQIQLNSFQSQFFQVRFRRFKSRSQLNTNNYTRKMKKFFVVFVALFGAGMYL